MFYKGKEQRTDLCVCIIDDTDQYKPWMRELVKNTADYTVTNVTGFGYDVHVGRDEHLLLKQVAGLYQKAVVISAGTEFINGRQFFDNLPDDFFVLGHVLDMGEGYYGLHYQCYVINLDRYVELGCPHPGVTEMLSPHTQIEPKRSIENIHDDYTPLWISKGNTTRSYKNKFHGWRIIQSGLEANLEIRAFDATLRDSKHYLYRDVDTSDWIYKRYNYCLANHTFDTGTGDISFPRPYNCKISHLIHPAAGMIWLDKLKINGYTKNTKVTFFDYNENALDTMYERTKNISMDFEFVHLDIIAEPEKIVDLIHDPYNPAGIVVHMSNIFAYEGTAALMPLRYRVQQENKLISAIQSHSPIVVLDFDQRAAEGFVPWRAETGLAKDLKLTDLSTVELPSWHTYD
jgi:hypothetical protein